MLFKSHRSWVVIAAGVLVSSVGIGTAWSYLRTAHAALGQSIRDSVPIEFELKRLEQMADDLAPDIKANMKVAADLEAKIEDLEHDVQATRQSQAEAKAQMQKLRRALDEKRDTFEFGGKTFTRKEIEQDLARRLERYDRKAKQLTAQEGILEARKKTLAAATDKINQYQQEREQLVQTIDSLKAEYELAKLTQATESFRFDSTKLAQAKELERKIKTDIRSRVIEAEREAQAPGEVPVDADSRPVTQRVDERFKNE
jgi:DNA repair exonuclease SbcCD ATPase subunit